MQTRHLSFQVFREKGGACVMDLKGPLRRRQQQRRRGHSVTDSFQQYCRVTQSLASVVGYCRSALEELCEQKRHTQSHTRTHKQKHSLSHSHSIPLADAHLHGRTTSSEAVTYTRGPEPRQMAAKVTFIIWTAFLVCVCFYDDCCPNAFNGGGGGDDRDDDLCFISPPIHYYCYCHCYVYRNYCINGPRRTWKTLQRYCHLFGYSYRIIHLIPSVAR